MLLESSRAPCPSSWWRDAWAQRRWACLSAGRAREASGGRGALHECSRWLSLLAALPCPTGWGSFSPVPGCAKWINRLVRQRIPWVLACHWPSGCCGLCGRAVACGLTVEVPPPGSSSPVAAVPITASWSYGQNPWVSGTGSAFGEPGRGVSLGFNKQHSRLGEDRTNLGCWPWELLEANEPRFPHRGQG